MQRLLIIQENGRHARNQKFRECFALQRAFAELGVHAEVWGLGHKNYASDFPALAATFDAVLSLENYDSGWHPDLAPLKIPKMFWCFDAHVHPERLLQFARSNRFDAVFSATQHYVSRFARVAGGAQWLPNAADHFLLDRMYPVERSVPLGFCGNTGNRGEWLQFLQQQHGLQQAQMVLGPDMVRAVNSYQVHWNRNMGLDINYRTFETLACGSFLLTNYTPGLEQLFNIGEHLAVYAQRADLERQLQDYLHAPEECERIARAGYAHVRSQHTYVRRAQQILSVLGVQRPTLEDTLHAIPNAGENTATVVAGVHCYLPYQSMPLENGSLLPGLRSYAPRVRDLQLDDIDFNGKTVLDLGANLGMLCLEAKRRGAARVVGVDNDPQYVHAARQLAARSGIAAEYMQLDLNRFDFSTFTDTFGLDQFDVVFCCSMIENLTNAGSFSRSLAPHIAETYYLEGHSADGAREVQRYRGYLESMGFAAVQTLHSTDSGQNAPGELNGHARPAFRGQRA